ncbi:MAG: hypothetical protein ACYDA3_02000 [Gaiellaceae bacterium]
MESLAELRERRAFECRLTPDRALTTIDEAAEFLRGRGLLTRTPDSALPSLYEACHQEPYKAGVPGFATWPATKWPWFGELGRTHLILKVHRGKNLLVTDDTAALLDPICRAEIERMRAADDDWRRLLDHLAAAGPSALEDLQLELGWKPKALKLVRSPLERCGAIVSRNDVLSRWDQLSIVNDGELPGEGVAQDTVEIVLAGVRAAVVAPERELQRWFSWQWYWTDTLIDDLVREGRLRRVNGYVTATETPA